MTLKYIFVLGEKRVPGFGHIFSFCHAPIDNFVMEEAAKKGLPKLPCKWSRLDDYAVCMDTQNWFRGCDQPPLATEFELWLAGARREGGKAR